MSKTTFLGYVPSLKEKHEATIVEGKAIESKGGSIRYTLRGEYEGRKTLPKTVSKADFEGIYGFDAKAAEDAVMALNADTVGEPTPASVEPPAPSDTPFPQEPTNENFSAESDWAFPRKDEYNLGNLHGMDEEALKSIVYQIITDNGKAEDMVALFQEEEEDEGHIWTLDKIVEAYDYEDCIDYILENQTEVKESFLGFGDDEEEEEEEEKPKEQEFTVIMQEGDKLELTDIEEQEETGDEPKDEDNGEDEENDENEAEMDKGILMICPSCDETVPEYTSCMACGQQFESEFDAVSAKVTRPVKEEEKEDEEDEGLLTPKNLVIGAAALGAVALGSAILGAEDEGEDDYWAGENAHWRAEGEDLTSSEFVPFDQITAEIQEEWDETTVPVAADYEPSNEPTNANFSAEQTSTKQGWTITHYGDKRDTRIAKKDGLSVYIEKIPKHSIQHKREGANWRVTYGRYFDDGSGGRIIPLAELFPTYNDIFTWLNNPPFTIHNHAENFSAEFEAGKHSGQRSRRKKQGIGSTSPSKARQTKYTDAGWRGANDRIAARQRGQEDLLDYERNKADLANQKIRAKIEAKEDLRDFKRHEQAENFSAEDGECSCNLDRESLVWVDYDQKGNTVSTTLSHLNKCLMSYEQEGKLSPYYQIKHDGCGKHMDKMEIFNLPFVAETVGSPSPSGPPSTPEPAEATGSEPSNEHMEAEADNTKLVIGITALGIGLAVVLGKDRLKTLFDRFGL